MTNLPLWDLLWLCFFFCGKLMRNLVSNYKFSAAPLSASEVVRYLYIRDLNRPNDTFQVMFNLIVNSWYVNPRAQNNISERVKKSQHALKTKLFRRRLSKGWSNDTITNGGQSGFAVMSTPNRARCLLEFQTYIGTSGCMYNSNQVGREKGGTDGHPIPGLARKPSFWCYS